MHIPDGFLTPRVWVTLDVVSASLVAAGVRRVSSVFEEKAIPLMGVLAAFVFAAQMINIPVAGGTSGHFLGGGLVGALLGPWAGLIVMTVVLVAQCFLFQDGGVAALGANIFNMGVIGAMGGALLYRTAMGALPGRKRVFWAGFIAGSVSMVMSAAGCAMQLAISHVITWSAGFAVIVGLHGLAGMMEGLVTGSVLQGINASRPDLLQEQLSRFTLREGMIWLILIALVCGLAPFASDLPDALQKMLGTR